MINLIRADFYKLFHTKVFYICTFIVICFVGIAAAVFSYMDHMPEENKAMLMNAGDENSRDNVSVDEDTDLSITFLESGTQFVSGIFQEWDSIVLIIGIMIAILVGGEFKERTMKSMVAKGYKREHIVFTKVFVNVCSVITMFIIVLLFALIVGSILSGHVNTFTSVELMAKGRFLFGELMCFIAYTMLFTLIAFVIRNIEFSLITNILILTLIPSVLTLIENTWKIPFSKIQLSTGLYKIIENNGAVSSIAHMGILFVAYAVISTVGSCIFFKRADVK
ncbi:ABC transporter permease subunit [Anaerosporobacter sp.]